MKDISYSIKRFFRKVKNVFHWLPVIWKDENFDQWYLYKILLTKITSMRKHFEYCADPKNDMVHHVGIESEIRQMKVCEALLQRELNDYYEMMGYDEAEEKLGKLEMVLGEPNEKGSVPVTFTRNGEDSRVTKPEYWKIMERWERQHKKSRELLFKILNGKSEGWWI